METKILEQLAQLVLPKEILERFLIVKIETDESDIDAMSMTIHLDERINKEYQGNTEYCHKISTTFSFCTKFDCKTIFFSQKN